jgi:hypothetical protein
MRVVLASASGRPNEDFAAVVPGTAVLLDGAGYHPASGIGCVHGIAWYARTLGGLLARPCPHQRCLDQVLGEGPVTGQQPSGSLERALTRRHELCEA